MKFYGRVALITGAGGGIGRACALAFAHEGAKLILFGLSEASLKETKGLTYEAGAETLTYSVDICDEKKVEAAVANAVGKFGSPSILVNLAGNQGPGAAVWEAEPAEWKRCMDVNLYGTFVICSKVIPHMIEAGYGRIINVASGAGQHPMSYFSAYSASKAGVIHFSRTIAEELAPYGITVNSLGVRGITQMWQDVINAPGGAGTTRGVEEMIKNGFNPIPEENIPSFLFLASEDAGHVTGQYFEANMLPACRVEKRYNRDE